MLDLHPVTNLVSPTSGQTLLLLRKLKEAGEPITISINGRGNLPITDDGAYQLLFELVDRLELTEVLRERLADLDTGRPTLRMEEAKEQVRAKYGISL